VRCIDDIAAPHSFGLQQPDLVLGLTAPARKVIEVSQSASDLHSPQDLADRGSERDHAEGDGVIGERFLVGGQGVRGFRVEDELQHDATAGAAYGEKVADDLLLDHGLLLRTSAPGAPTVPYPVVIFTE